MSSEEKAAPKGEAIEEEEQTLLDWTIVVTDTQGRESRLKLSADQPLYPQIQSRTSRMPLLSTNPTSEIVMRRFTLPLSKFVEANSTFDPLSIVSMKFVFDQTKKGIIAVDDFGVE